MSEELRIREIFNDAIERTGEARASYLDTACAADSPLRRRVEALLHAAEVDDQFLSAPTLPPGHNPTVHSASLEAPGTRIGPYKILQLIGEGGFGSVFMAEQLHPVQRKVALKIIKLGMDTHQVVARFEQERQALAMMDHPNIARVLDAGATERGRPFFVMELVKGDPIVDYCDRNNLSITERLDLFTQVCNAVQHAHTKGIIHRDIKPSNILVSTQDGRPCTKIIDFGIAKATSARLTERTLFTEHRQLVGTPEYMSPEQAEGSLDIDTRTDVYSLGVLLYELLTGSTPFSSKQLRAAAYAEIQRIIREVDPPKPSTRLSQSTLTLHAVAAHRHTEPHKLSTSIRGDLDWIVMKAMEKDRARRYDSASGLAGDVLRHLAGDAVLAAPPGRAYRLKKFVRRHRAPVIAGSCIVVALIAGLSVALWQHGVARAHARDAAHSERMAIDKRREAEDNLRLATQAQARAVEAEQATGKALAREIDAHRESDGHRLAAQAMTMVDEDPTLALLLAIEGARRASGDDIALSLYQTLDKHHERAIWLGHDDPVRYVAVSPDARRIATSDDSGLIILWDANTGEPVGRLDEHTALSCLGFTPDGRTLFSASRDGTARLWSTTTARCDHVLHHPAPVRLASLNPALGALYTAAGDTLHAWDIATGRELGPPHRLGGAVSSLELSPDGASIASVAVNGELTILDASSWTARHRWKLPNPAGRLADADDIHRPIAHFVSQGRLLVRTPDGSAELWDPRAGERLGVLGEPGACAGVTPSPDGRSAVLRMLPNAITLGVWNLDTGTETTRLETPWPEGYRAGPIIRWSDDSERIVIGGTNNERAIVFEAVTGRHLASLRGHILGLYDARFLPDGARLVTVGHDHAVRLWTTQTGRVHEGLSRVVARGGVQMLSISADGNRALLRNTAEPGAACDIIDTRTGSLIEEARGPTPGVPAGWLADERLLISVAPRITLLDTVSGRTTTLGEEPFAVSSITPDRRRLAGFRDGVYSPGDRIAVFDLERGACIMDVREPGQHCTSAALSPDGTRLLTTHGHHNMARVWDVGSAKVLHTFPRHGAYVTNARWSPDGSRIVEFSIDTTAGIYDGTTFSHVATITGLHAAESIVSMSPDSRLVAILSPFELAVRDLQTGARVAHWRHRGDILHAAFTPDGRDLLFVNAARVVRFLPLAPLDQALRVVPRALTGTEMHRFDVGTPEDRAAAAARTPATSTGLQRVAETALTQGRLDDAIATFEQALTLRARPRATLAYNTACAYARRAALPDRTETQRSQDADASLRLLRRAVQAGFRNHDLMRQDPDLDAVRERDGFESILASTKP